MTFKHLKFAESSTMQAFEKFAKDKGLVKNEAPKKAASKTLNLNPSENLLDNVLKLATGLRSQGFHKHADDLEKKFLQFKQADALYETSKETGDDLVDQAHPKGSHKLEGVEGDATVETITDIKKKIEEIANKQPTGKQASSKKLATSIDIINAVKTVFAAPNDLEKAKEFATQARQLVDNITRMTSEELTFSISGSVGLAAKYAANPTVYNLNAFKEMLDRLYKRLNPSIISGGTYGIGGLSEYTWQRVVPLIEQARALVEQAIEARKQYDNDEQPRLEGRPESPAKPITINTVEVASDPLSTKIGQYLKKLEAYEGVISSARGFTPAERKQGLDWIKSQMADFNRVQDAFDKITDENSKATVRPRYEREINDLAKEVDEFYTNWIA